MSQADPENFDDPALKAAIRRAWAGEQCPPEVRQRIDAAYGRASASSLKIESGRPKLLGNLMFFGWALAAVMLIVVGIVFHFHPDKTGQLTRPVALALPASLADQLIARHDECCKDPDHHMPGLPRDNFVDIGRELRQRLGFPILSAGLPGAWNFNGASICPVGTTKSGHLVFKSGDGQFVSIFSLPRQFGPADLTNKSFSEVEQNHPMAGFATGDGFYCVVESSKGQPMSLEQVRTLRDELRPDVASVTDPNRRDSIALVAK